MLLCWEGPSGEAAVTWNHSIMFPKGWFKEVTGLLQGVCVWLVGGGPNIKRSGIKVRSHMHWADAGGGRWKLASIHDDVIKWKHFPRYWPFVRGIHRSPVKGQWRGAFMFSLICARIKGWVNNGEAGDLRCHRAHYDVTVMKNHYIYSHIHSRGAGAEREQNPILSYTIILNFHLFEMFPLSDSLHNHEEQLWPPEDNIPP